MPESTKDDWMSVDFDSFDSQLTGEWGWYLYGVTLGKVAGQAELLAGMGLNPCSKVRLLSRGDLAAVVSRVPLAEFGPTEFRAGVQDAAWLEAAVRGHERVVERVHRQRTILPAKFGRVYATPKDLVDALGQAHDGLLALIRRLEGCDEYGVVLYARVATIRQRLATERPEVRLIERDLLGAQPGRAYFLRKRLEDVLDSTTEEVLGDIAQRAYAHMVSRSVAGHLSRLSDQRGAFREEVDILRASFLLIRSSAGSFVDRLESFVASAEGLRCVYSGPWPPYSFLEVDGDRRDGGLLDNATKPEVRL